MERLLAQEECLVTPCTGSCGMHVLVFTGTGSWHACAGIHWSQYLDKLEVSTHQQLDQYLPMFNLPPKILCSVVNVELQWGAPTFDGGEAFAMMAASFVALVESTGAFIAVSRYASATPIPPSVHSRGIGWQASVFFWMGYLGLEMGLLFSRKFGLLALTRLGSRRVVQISAGFMIFFSILGGVFEARVILA